MKRIIGVLFAAAVLALTQSSSALATNFVTACGGVGDNTTDNTAALNSCYTTAFNGDKVIDFPYGSYRFASAPNPLTNVVLRGKDGWATLVRDYNTNPNASVFYDFLDFRGTNNGVYNLQILAGANTYGGSAIRALATNAIVFGFMTIEDVIITSGSNGTWGYPLNLNGSLRTTGGTMGVRAIDLRNVHVFNATVEAVRCYTCIGVTWEGGGVYQGAGTTSAIHIMGDATAGYSTKVKFEANIVSGTVTVDAGNTFVGPDY